MLKREVRKLSVGQTLQLPLVRSPAPVSAELSALGFEVAQHALRSGDSESMGVMAVRTSSPRVSELQSSSALQPSASETVLGLQPSAALGAAASASGAQRASAAEFAFLAPYAAGAGQQREGAAEPDDESLMAHFFACGDDDDLDAESAWLNSRDRLVMRATVAMIAVFVVAISGFLFYYRVVMPVPAELGAAPLDLGLSSAESEATAVMAVATSRVPPSLSMAAPEPALPPAAVRDVAASAVRVPARRAAASVQPSASGAAVSGSQSAAATFKSLLEEARVFARRRQNQRALDAYEQALRLQPGEASALAGKAYAYLNLDDRRAAKRFASLAVAADPTSSQGWVVLGAAEELLGSRRASQEAFRRCAAQAVGGYVNDCRQLVR
jgi:tetratricopeptide (TPR) repeat protein